ncbi:hypothetical protein [Fimbriiglobus ruber]|uniref:hypothetical protein n=1 Tax=Fimbriiglobus ruber TaxID=1908690 RepID=UPI000B4B0ED3|nr:hypothetical protein [Fimbriiglobus ruber]
MNAVGPRARLEVGVPGADELAAGEVPSLLFFQRRGVCENLIEQADAAFLGGAKSDGVRVGLPVR